LYVFFHNLFNFNPTFLMNYAGEEACSLLVMLELMLIAQQYPKN